MAPTKFRVKKAFGMKKRYCKPRGKSGGRNNLVDASFLESSTSSETPIAKPNDQLADMERCTFSSVEAELLANSATKRKFSLFSSLENDLRDVGEENTSIADDTVSAGDSMSSIGFQPVVAGYRLVAVDFITSLINSLACSKCGHSDLDIKERRLGLKSIFSVTCTTCEKNVKISSTRNDSIDVNEPNLLAVAASRNSGIGYSTMCSLMGNLDIPKPMHLKTYQECAKKVHGAAMTAVEENLQMVATIIHKQYSSDLPSTNKKVTDVAVSFDGTWHKRGHSSLFGVGVAIDLLTGFVLDFSCQSKYCHGCQVGPKPTDSNYEEWKVSHADVCQINFSGTSNAMEMEAAVKIFERSLSKYSMRYTTMLCDGDSKAFQKVKDNNPYGDDFPVSKQDCINHVSKRMGTALRKLKQEERLGGRGKLTNETIIKLQNYYGKALKDNAPNVEKMKNAAYASLFHIISTDDEPHHRFCPPGETSWCHYQRSLCDNKKTTHRPLLSKGVGERLLPIYKRLTDDQLLQRCAVNKTQNANECFNSLIWRRCPKTEFTSLQTLETAVAMAVLEHNKGAHGYFCILDNLGIKVGHSQLGHANLKDKLRISDCERSLLQKRKKVRKIKKLQQAKEDDKLEKEEGVTYQAGGF